MGNRAGSIPALGTRKIKRASLALYFGKKIEYNIKLNKGQAGDLNIRYNSKQAKCPESSVKGGVSNDYRSCKRR